MRRASLALMVGLLVGICLPTPASQARPLQNPATVSWWQPTGPLTLHWNLGGAINVNNPKHIGERGLDGSVLPRPAVLDIDGEYNSAATVAALKARGQRVICYIDAGVWESYRPDADVFPNSVIGKKDAGWDGSFWLDVRAVSVLLPIMEARVRDWCAGKGFDGVEIDETDGWENATGFPITYQHQLTYNRALADMIHSYGLAAVHKGNIIQSQDLEPWFDAALIEECGRYSECDNPWNPVTKREVPGAQVYSNAGKPVWVAEYRATDLTKACRYVKKYPAWRVYQFRLGLPLNGGRKPC